MPNRMYIFLLIDNNEGYKACVKWACTRVVVCVSYSYANVLLNKGFQQLSTAVTVHTAVLRGHAPWVLL
jgi:hypothetical protein